MDRGLAYVTVDADTATQVAADLNNDSPFPDAVRPRLLAAQLADLAAGDDTVVTDDEIVTTWATFSRWTVEPDDPGYRIVIARPGMRSTLAWSPELGEPGPDSDAVAELRDALAAAHPALGRCELHIE